MPLPSTGTFEEGKAMGLGEPFEINGAHVCLINGDGTVLRLIEWVHPKSDDDPPYPPPINHIGVDGMAFFVADLDASVAALKAQGVVMLSDIADCCDPDVSDTFGIVNFYDPDGTFIDMAGAIVQPRP